MAFIEDTIKVGVSLQLHKKCLFSGVLLPQRYIALFFSIKLFCYVDARK